MSSRRTAPIAVFVVFAFAVVAVPVVNERGGWSES